MKRVVTSMIALALVAGACGGDNADDDAGSGEASDTQLGTAEAEPDSGESDPETATAPPDTEESTGTSGTDTADFDPTTTTAAPTSTETIEKVRFGAGTPNAGNWAIQVGVAEGIFEQYGTEVELQFVGSTPASLAGLASGSLDFTSGAMDGMVNAHLQDDEFIYIAGGYDFLPYDLIVDPSITDVSQIDGKTCAANQGPTSGDGIWLQLFIDGLSNGTIVYPGNYSVVQAAVANAQGAVAALESGSVQCLATIAPVSNLVIAEGFHRLAESKDVSTFDNVPFFGITAFRSWVDENPETTIQFLTGYLASIAWLYDPANKDRAIEILAENSGVAPEVVAGAYEWVDPLAGYPRDGSIPDDAIRKTVEIQQKYAGQLLSLRRDITDEIVDLSYVEQAYDRLPAELKVEG